MLAIILAFGLAWLASVAGSAMIIGAFAAGLLLRGTPHAHEIEKGVASLGHFFVPLFFVAVGASVDIQVFNPLNSENYMTLMIGGCLVVAAIVGKYLAGFAPFWYRGNKQVIGVGMIPRGEVGLIFAQMGLSTGVFDMGFFWCCDSHGDGHDLCRSTLVEMVVPETSNSGNRSSFCRYR